MAPTESSCGPSLSLSRFAQEDAREVGAEDVADPIRQLLEQLAQVEVLERRLGHLLELPQRVRHRLGLGARGALLGTAALLGHVHDLPDVAQRALMSVVQERHAHERVHHALVGALEAQLALVEARLLREDPLLLRTLGLTVGGVHELPERAPRDLARRNAEQHAERPVHLDEVALHRAQRHADRRPLEGRPEALLRCPERRVLLLELEQHRDLRTQDVRVDGLEDVVHGAALIAARDLVDVRVRRGQEDHGGVRVPGPLLDQLDGLEAVQPGHAHVHHDHREVAVEQPAQRLLARPGGHELPAERREHGLDGGQVLPLVVDDEDARCAAHDGFAYLCSQTRMSESS